MGDAACGWAADDWVAHRQAVVASSAWPVIVSLCRARGDCGRVDNESATAGSLGVDKVGRKLVIGLAGGIGAGKSTVARFLADNGVGVVDSDRLNGEQLEEPEVVAELARWYGPDIRKPGGGVCREVLARIVFDDPAQRRRVEGLLHPRIARRRQELIENFQADPRIRAVALDSPLLFETGLDRGCDLVIFVDAPAAQRARRLAATRGWSAEEVCRREKSQEPLDNKGARADYIVENKSGLDDLRSKVEKLLSELLAQASRG